MCDCISNRREAKEHGSLRVGDLDLAENRVNKLTPVQQKDTNWLEREMLQKGL